MMAVLQRTQKIALDARAAGILKTPLNKSGSALKSSRNSPEPASMSVAALIAALAEMS
jgi:hypothetical protein